MRALELGAVDFVTKPKLGIRDGLMEYTGPDRRQDPRRAPRAKLLAPARQRPAARRARRRRMLRTPLLSHRKTDHRRRLHRRHRGHHANSCMPLPPDSPAILIAQHMPAGFTNSFAQRLNGLCRITVTEAEHGERVLPGHAYIAPGDSHLLLTRSGANYVAHRSTRSRR